MGAPILKAAEIPTLLPGDPPVDVPSSRRPRRWPSRPCRWATRTRSLFVDDVMRFPLEVLGPMLEHHPMFPRRVNVHVVEVLGPGEVRMRTWERGSGITLACGTGACAVCVAGVLTGRTERKVLAHLPGGDLQLEWPGDASSVFMTGPATEVFSGEWPGEWWAVGSAGSGQHGRRASPRSATGHAHLRHPLDEVECERLAVPVLLMPWATFGVEYITEPGPTFVVLPSQMISPCPDLDDEDFLVGMHVRGMGRLARVDDEPAGDQAGAPW